MDAPLTQSTAESAGAKKILVIDDDEPTRESYVTFFREAGFEVTAARDGEEGWERLRGGYVPDIVFSGIIMPRMTGFDLLKRMKADPTLARVPFIISSHHGLPEQKKLAVELGANGFIVRDLTPPRDVIEYLRLVLGLGGKMRFRVAFLPERYDGQAFADFMNRQQGTFCTPGGGKELYLDIESSGEKGVFRVQLGC